MNIKLTRRTAMVLAVAVTAAGLFVASGVGASANDTVSEACSTYHDWTECITYDSSADLLEVNAYNGYGVTEDETVWLTDEAMGENFSIPSFASYGYGVFSNDPGSQCAGIDSQTVVCGNF